MRDPQLAMGVFSPHRTAPGISRRTAMSARPFLRRSLFAIVLWASMVLAASAQGVGAIGGTITPSSGAGLPRAGGTPSNPRTIGGGPERGAPRPGAALISPPPPGPPSGEGAQARLPPPPPP